MFKKCLMSYIFVTFRTQRFKWPCWLISMFIAIVLLWYSPCNESPHSLLHSLFISAFIYVQVIGNINHPSLHYPPPTKASWHIFLCHLKDQILYFYLRVSLKQTCWQSQGLRKFTSSWSLEGCSGHYLLIVSDYMTRGDFPKVYFYGFSRISSTKIHCMVTRRVWVLSAPFFFFKQHPKSHMNTLFWVLYLNSGITLGSTFSILWI